MKYTVYCPVYSIGSRIVVPEEKPIKLKLNRYIVDRKL